MLLGEEALDKLVSTLAAIFGTGGVAAFVTGDAGLLTPAETVKDHITAK
ncbi:MAG: hypothetical protein IJK33_03155 [Clostridia bacterium]|nr:hypothetical protein [Clostridia bacterium]